MYGRRDVDRIANLTSAYFNQMPLTNMIFIDALVDAKLPYLDILKSIDAKIPSDVNAHVVVRGEEDNLFVPSNKS